MFEPFYMNVLIDYNTIFTKLNLWLFLRDKILNGELEVKDYNYKNVHILKVSKNLEEV